MDDDAPSYHDVVVTVDGKAHRIRDNYAYNLMCTRVAGWRLFWEWDGKSQLIGGEFDGCDFRIEVRGMVICDVKKTSGEDEDEEPKSAPDSPPGTAP